MAKPHRPWRLTLVASFAALVAVLAGCGTGGDGGVRVVASTSILGDLARQVVGDTGTVDVLMDIGVDPHDFAASPKQAATLVEADLVVVNGLGLEEGLDDLLTAVEGDGANLVRIGPDVNPISLAGGTDPDPHVWMDPVRMADAVVLIAAELDAAVPDATAEERQIRQANADAYRAALLAAHQRMEEILRDIPAAARTLVTNHDALGYFAERFGFEVIGVVIPGGSTLAEPSAADLAAVVRTIEEAGVPAIFAETIEPTTLADAIAAELGNRVQVVELYTGSLGGPGSGAETLVDMLVLVAERIAGALG